MKCISLGAVLVVGLRYGCHAEAPDQTQPEWNIVEHAEQPHLISTTFSFHQSRLHEAKDLFEKISDPQSPLFGQHLDDDALTELFAPSHESVRSVLGWLGERGVVAPRTRLYKHRAILQFDATVEELHNLIPGSHQIGQRRDTEEQELLEHSVPRALAQHVESISTRLRAAAPHKRSVSFSHDVETRDLESRDLTACGKSWTPACIRDLYDIPLGDQAAENNSLGIYGFGDAYNQADLDLFFEQFAKTIPKGTAPKVNSINGAKSPGDPISGEEDLDLQMAYPIAFPQSIEIFQTPFNNKGGFGNDFLDAIDGSYCTYDGGDDEDYDVTYPQFEGFQGPAMCGEYKPTNVISISFAQAESTVSQRYLERQCHEWMKLALKGVTVVVAAGDTGVQSQTGCMVNPKNTSASAFAPLFPASCPYVTVVGATQVDFVNGTQKEVAVFDPPHNFYSGGGFSNVNARPAYQAETVSQYIANHNPGYPEGTFNMSGRAYPDVAVLGALVTVVTGGNVTVSGGTSAATPLFAAMINRINDERLLACKGPIGFLNSILYQHPEVFTDITEGRNSGCGTAGFSTAQGWDPVTGMGTPIFPKLRDLLLGLP